MKFKTTDLIARIDDLIAQRVKDADTTHADEVAKVANQREAWLSDHGPAYVEFANRIKEKIRKGRPITRADIPQGVSGRFRELEVFNATEKPKKRPAVTDDLETLKTALLAVSDEYVTTTGLREIGFKDIARLFRGN